MKFFFPLKDKRPIFTISSSFSSEYYTNPVTEEISFVWLTLQNEQILENIEAKSPFTCGEARNTGGLHYSKHQASGSVKEQSVHKSFPLDEGFSDLDF